MASQVVTVNFPEHPSLRSRSIVVRPDSPAAVLCSKIMGKCGLKGVGSLFLVTMMDGVERRLGREEDVYGLLEEHGAKQCFLVFRGDASDGAESGSSSAPVPSRAVSEPDFSSSRRPTVPRGPAPISPKETVDIPLSSSPSLDVTDHDALMRRLLEQEKIIMTLQRQVVAHQERVAQLEAIEKEQQRIIDAQIDPMGKAAKKNLPLGGGGGGGGGGGIRVEMELEKLRIALDDERQQHKYTREELQELKQQKAEYIKRLKTAGAMVEDDNPENAAGCTQPQQCSLM